MTDSESANHDSFLRLYATHEPAIRGFVRSLLPTRADASDVMQEVAIVLWRKFDQLDEAAHFRKWAFGVARYEALAWRRDRARDRHFFTDDLSHLIAEEAEEKHEFLDVQRKALEHCLAKLPKEKVSLLRNAYDGEKRIDALAEELNRTAMSVYKVLHRLRMKLLNCTETFLRKERISS